MLLLQNCNKIHEDFIEATDFLGKMYQAHEDLILANPANCITHFKSCDKDLERVRKCFKRLETFMVSDNYFRSVSGLAPAPFLEQQLSQLALEQNNSDYLTTLARLEVHLILRTVEQPGMYVDRSIMSNQSSPITPARSGSQQGTPSRWTAASTLIDLKEGYHSVQANEGPANGPKEHNPLSAFHPHQQALFKCTSIKSTSSHLFTRYGTSGNPKYTRNDLTQAYSTSWTQQWQPLKVQQQPCVFNPLTLQLVLHPLHRLGWMFLSLLL